VIEGGTSREKGDIMERVTEEGERKQKVYEIV